MADEIVRAMTADGYVKAVAVTGRDLVERARNIHTLLPMATAALGRALLGASMLGDMLKEQRGSLTLQIKGGGPLGTVLAVSDYEGNVRGYVQNPHVELMEKHQGKLDVGAAVGSTGTLTVIKDIGLKEPYVGSIGLFSGEIADDLAMYFVESEQIPTACALGVLVGTDQSVTSAGGYLIQLLPGASDDIIDKIEAGGPPGGLRQPRPGGRTGRRGPAAGGPQRLPAGNSGEAPGGVPVLLLPGPGHPRPHQHGPGGAVLPHPGPGPGRPHLPVLR